MKEKLLWLIQQWWFWLFLSVLTPLPGMGTSILDCWPHPTKKMAAIPTTNSQNHHCWISQSNFSFIFVSYFLFFLFVFILYLNQFVSWSYRDDKAIQFELDFTILKPLQMRLFDKI